MKKEQNDRRIPLLKKRLLLLFAKHNARLFMRFGALSLSGSSLGSESPSFKTRYIKSPCIVFSESFSQRVTPSLESLSQRSTAFGRPRSVLAEFAISSALSSLNKNKGRKKNPSQGIVPAGAGWFSREGSSLSLERVLESRVSLGSRNVFISVCSASPK